MTTTNRPDTDRPDDDWTARLTGDIRAGISHAHAVVSAEILRRLDHGLDPTCTWLGTRTGQCRHPAVAAGFCAKCGAGHGWACTNHLGDTAARVTCSRCHASGTVQRILRWLPIFTTRDHA